MHNRAKRSLKPSAELSTVARRRSAHPIGRHRADISAAAATIRRNTHQLIRAISDLSVDSATAYEVRDAFAAIMKDFSSRGVVGRSFDFMFLGEATRADRTLDPTIV